MPYGILCNETPLRIKDATVTASWGTRNQAQDAADAMTTAQVLKPGQVKRELDYKPFLIPDDWSTKKATSNVASDYSYIEELP